MRQAIFHGPGRPITIEPAEVTPPGPDDVLIKVARCGICGSDVSMTGNTVFTFLPGPIGHEYAGEIVEVGANVTGLKPGQRVACLPSSPCGACTGCRTGNVVLCTARRQAAGGSSGFGGFGDYVTVPAIAARPLPASLSFADGALVEPMACGLHALRLAAMEPGARVLVLGAGTMALSVTYWARRLGAGRIVVASRSAHRREIAGRFGADAFHSFAEDDPAGLDDALGGPPDLVAECVGKEGMLGQAAGYVRPQGTVLSMGMCQCAEPVAPAAFNFRETKLVFPIAYTIDEFVETARAFDADDMPPEAMVSDVIALEALPGMIEQMRAGAWRGLKVQVDPTRGATE